MSQARAEAFVQTDLDVHQIWAALISVDKFAGVVLHVLISRMEKGCDPVVVIPQKLLAEMAGCSVRTLQRSLGKLAANNWIEIINLGRGTVAAYRVNSRVAWLRDRKDMRYAQFTGSIMADLADQESVSNEELRDVSVMLDGNITGFRSPPVVLNDEEQLSLL